MEPPTRNRSPVGPKRARRDARLLTRKPKWAFWWTLSRDCRGDVRGWTHADREGTEEREERAVERVARERPEVIAKALTKTPEAAAVVTEHVTEELPEARAAADRGSEKNRVKREREGKRTGAKQVLVNRAVRPALYVASRGSASRDRMVAPLLPLQGDRTAPAIS